MPSPRNRRHIVVPGRPTVEKYTRHRGGGNSRKPDPPPQGRPAHSAALKEALESARDTAALQKTQSSIEVTGARPGVYIEFESFPGWDLAISSLENKRKKDPLQHIEVVAVTSVEPKDDSEPKTTKQRAAVFVPEGRLAHFIQQLDSYALTTPKVKREHRHENIYDRIASIRLAALRGLWTDARCGSFRSGTTLTIKSAKCTPETDLSSSPRSQKMRRSLCARSSLATPARFKDGSNEIREPRRVTDVDKRLFLRVELARFFD